MIGLRHLFVGLNICLTFAATAVCFGGAPAGYVEDQACAICHSDLYEPYQEVGMARSFAEPSRENDIEDFDAVFYHEASRRYYEMRRRDDRLFFRRYQLNTKQERVHEIEIEVDWILGSGHRARTYLYQTDAGDLFQLPIAWYSQSKSWGMAPGFDQYDHEGVERRVTRECLFCHNAYPAMPPGGDAQSNPHRFPAELPQGTGCQRCHGPAAAHLEAVKDMSDMDAVRASILNPADLPPRLRDDVCEQCHLQPLVALAGVRVIGRGDFSYRPGEPLSDYLVQVDAEMEDRTLDERFEINHHAYRLRRSPCFVQSDGELSCITCHDPHRKVAPEQRTEHYRNACQSCHEIDACRLEEMTDTSGASSEVDPLDCVACHMPQRRPQDVVRVVMTDHFIRRRPGGPELTAPREEETPILVDAFPYESERAPQGDHWRMYRTLSVLQALTTEPAVRALEALLDKVKPKEIEPYLDLAEGQIRVGFLEEAEKTLAPWLEKSLQARDLQAGLRLAQGRSQEAIERFREVLREDPDRAEAWLNLGIAQIRTGAEEDGLLSIRRATEVRPYFKRAWLEWASVSEEIGRTDDAESGYRRILQIDPAHTKAGVALRRLLSSHSQPAGR